MLSSAIQPAAEAFASLYGVKPDRVIGTRVHTVNGKLTARVLDPVPSGVGRVEAAIHFIGDPPVLAVGGEGDEELLSYGRGLRIVVVPGTGVKADGWRAKGWLVQPESPAAP
jgi:hypothetical protein